MTDHCKMEDIFYFTVAPSSDGTQYVSVQGVPESKPLIGWSLNLIKNR